MRSYSTIQLWKKLWGVFALLKISRLKLSRITFMECYAETLHNRFMYVYSLISRSGNTTLKDVFPRITSKMIMKTSLVSPLGNQRLFCETEFFCTINKKSMNTDIIIRFELSIGGHSFAE